MWGQVDIAVNTADRPRIIPTRVGTRATCIVFSRSIKDHPHACGDKSPFRNPLAVCQGSSPRVWGQVSDTNLLPYKERIIPTRVGTRFNTGTPWHADEDHPHACGDKPCTDLKKASAKGSSPRVWGQVPLLIEPLDRIVNHPHACGDKYSMK